MTSILSFLCKRLLICTFWQFCLKVWILSFDTHFQSHWFCVLQVFCLGCAKCFDFSPVTTRTHFSAAPLTKYMNPMSLFGHEIHNVPANNGAHIPATRDFKKPISVNVLRGHFRRHVALSNYLPKPNNKCIVAKLFLSFFLASLIPSPFIFLTFLLKSLSYSVSVRVVPFIGFLSTEDLSHLPGHFVQRVTLHVTNIGLEVK